MTMSYGKHIKHCIYHTTGSPKPELQWTHNGKNLRRNASAGIDVYHVEDRAALKVSHAFPKAGGQYVCKARNVAGEATTTATVTVLPIQAETSDSEGVPFKPAFQVPLENVTVSEGDDVILESVVVGNPEPRVTWYKDGALLHPSATVHIRTLGDCRRLLLRSIKCEDGGDYKVKVTLDTNSYSNIRKASSSLK